MARDLSKPRREISWRVEADDEGGRLDHWLSQRVPWRSRTDLQRRIAAGRVLVDGEVGRKGQRLRHGQEVRVLLEGNEEHIRKDVESIPLHVLHEDRHLIVIDKAPGHVVHPVGRHVTNTVLNALHVRHHLREHGPGEEPPMIVHRLDRDTSGVLVLAKNEEVRKALGRDFEERRVRKVYLALVEGAVTVDEGLIDEPIGADPNSDNKTRVACVPGGKPSRTHFQVVARAPRMSLVRCRPETGRQHQIRVHLGAIGHPILCDALYGRPEPVTAGSIHLPGLPAGETLLARQALHAERLTFTHPATGEEMDVHAPLAADMQTLVRLCPGMQPI